uniref:Uncharacterized protein n=1 Tax=Arundo donax TaxID=35708 RepID=A0A0A8YIE4_ARUDO
MKERSGSRTGPSVSITSMFITVPDCIEHLFHLFLARKQLELSLPWVLELLA